jgi:hypothetical protein
LATWDPSFFRKSPLFWPIAGAAAKLERFAEWPRPEDLSALFAGDPPVRFERAPPQPRRAPLPANARYDARIALDRTVATRPGSWHDLLNALVWTAFPRAKLALHTRQHRMIAARLGEDLRLPGARTKEQDAVAMLDEGGVVLLCATARRLELGAAMKERAGAGVGRLVERGDATAVIFGHAIYEGLACARPERVYGAAYVVAADPSPVSVREQVAATDEALAALLERDAPITREEFGTVAVGEGLARVIDPSLVSLV